MKHGMFHTGQGCSNIVIDMYKTSIILFEDTRAYGL